MYKQTLSKIKHDDIIGATGALSLVSAYACTTHDLIKNKKIIDVMNMYGASAVGYNCWCKGTYPPMILEGFWFGIATTSLVKRLS